MGQPAAVVSLTFDDGLRCQFERAVPILDQHGFPATFFLVANTDPIHTDGYQHPDWRKTNWSADDIQFLEGMVQRGHEIGSHSVSHRLPELDANPRFEAEESKHWIETRLGLEVESYCYPFTHVTSPIKDAVINAGYKQARRGATRTYQPEQIQDLYEVNCRLVGRDGSENVSGWLQPDWYVVMFHGIGDTNDGWFPISLLAGC